MESILNQYTKEELEEMSVKRNLRNSIQKLKEEKNEVQREVENLHKTKATMIARQEENKQGTALCQRRSGKAEERRETIRETDSRRSSMDYEKMEMTAHQKQGARDREDEKRRNNRREQERREENVHNEERDRFNKNRDRREYRNSRFRIAELENR